jgi:hypothetical protein
MAGMLLGSIVVSERAVSATLAGDRNEWKVDERPEGCEGVTFL